jgi:hypothetical protein
MTAVCPECQQGKHQNCDGTAWDNQADAPGTCHCPDPSHQVSSDQTWLRGSWMQTFTGRKFYPLDPRPEEIDPRDIAHALSLICRFGGHTRRFYSVAEHCVLMSEVMPTRELALWALLHDATEAYVGDMVRPLKHHMPEYRAVEDRVMAAIAERFSLTTAVMPAEVKDADSRIILDERAALLSAPPEPWQQDELEPLGVHPAGWPEWVIEREYLARLRDLAPGMVGGDW